MVCPEQISSATLVKDHQPKDIIKDASKILKFPLVVMNEDFFYSTSGFDIRAMNSWYRQNGWYRPVNILLPVTLFYWCFAVAGYFGFWTRLFPPTAEFLALHSICGVLAIIQITCLLYCITVETQDNIVLKAKKPRNLNFHKVIGVPVIDPDTRFCDICQVQVQFETKHCKLCNKCVERYDHHCIFMSTCIGRKNYRQFLVAVTIAGFVGMYFGIVSIYGFVLYFSDRTLFYFRLLQVSQPLSQISEVFILIGIAIYLVAVMSASVALCGLSIFHARLSYIGMTNDAYFASRNARGPGIWSINTADYKKKMAEAKKFQIPYHSDLIDNHIIVSVDKEDVKIV